MTVKKFLLLTILCLALSSCESRTAPDPFSGDFSCETAFTRGGTEYILRYTKAGEQETAAVVTPATLAGLTAVREGGEITLMHEDVTFTALAADGFFAFAACLAPRELSYLADGCYGADGYKLYTSDAGLPTRVCNDTWDIRISNFKGDETQ